MLQRLLPIALLISSAAAKADSQGTEFRVVFPRNYELSSANVALSLSILNPNNADVSVYVSYYSEIFNTAKKPEALAFTVGAFTNFEQALPSFGAWEYTNGGFQQQFDTRIIVTTSLPIQLYANNFHKDGTGDSFLVLPYPMAGSSYAFTLPAPAPPVNGAIQYAVAYIVPTRADATVTVTVGGWVETRTIPFKQGSAVHYFAVPHTVGGKDPVFYITGDKDFLVTAAVTCLAQADGSCDHAAFMPSPVVLPGLCKAPTPIADNHPTDLMTTRRFTVTPNLASDECTHNVMNVYDGQASEEIFMYGESYTVPNKFGDRVILAADTIPTNPIRVGSLPGSGGTFLNAVPSTSQFVAGTTYFLTRSKSATLFIITDAVASLTMRLDDKPVNFSPEILKIDGVQYHFTTTVVTSDTDVALHKLDASPGKYTLYVVGSRQAGRAYGYSPAFNKLVTA